MMRVLDLFCGCGGSSAGARDAGAEIVCGVDAWRLAVETYRANFGSAVVETLTEDSGPGDVGRIDLLLASPPCVDHSPAKGGRPRDEGTRRTAGCVLVHARELRPRWIVVENVVQIRRWRGYGELVQGLWRLGYHVRPQVIDAADHGVPQSRRRLFLICDRLRDPPVVRSSGAGAVTAQDIVDFEGPWPWRPVYDGRLAPATLRRAERAIEALGRGVPFLVVYYGSDGSGGWQRLDRPLRTVTTIDRFAVVAWRGGEPVMRMLQVPELRRAMGFGEGHVLKGSRRDQVRMLGNAVCPPVMAAIVQALAG